MTDESITTLQAHPIWAELTPKQQKCLESILRGSDRVSAVVASYNCKNREHARTMSYSVFGTPRIIRALAIAEGEDPEKAVFMRNLERAVTDPETTPTQLNALKLLAQAKNFILPDASKAEVGKQPAGEQKFKIGDVVAQYDENGMEHRFVIEAREIES